MDTPLVSICSITYNHAPYIRQCLDGFLMQKTNFKYEIIIHDDASTDGTAEIIKEYAEKYPDLITPIFQKENQYSMGVRGFFARFVFPKAQGKYIAMCEGDDYWTDSLKLQKQVDVLECEPSYGCVYTAYETVGVDGNAVKFPASEIHMQRSFTGDILYALFVGNFPQTLTVLFRRSLLDYPINSPLNIDYSLFLRIALQSNFYYLPEITGIYRINPVGMIQSGDFFKLDIKGMLIFYYKEYIINERFRRNDKVHKRILFLFFKDYCNFSTLKRYKQYFKEICIAEPFLSFNIPFYVVYNFIRHRIKRILNNVIKCFK